MRNGSVDFLVYELLQNAFDADGVTEVHIDLRPTNVSDDGYWLCVADNSPKGFHDIAHAYTLFAPSIRKDDALKRGRFNIGEKLALVVAIRAILQTTCGEIYFNADGTREHIPFSRREVGSKIMLELRLTRDQVTQIRNAMDRVIVPEGISLCVQSAVWRHYEIPTRIISASLPTVIGEDLRPSIRKTSVEIHELDEDEQGWIYEMGIPVVEHQDPFHYNVLQKVPVTLDRTNVNDSRFLKMLSVAALNQMPDKITEETAHADWVTRGACQPDAAPEAIRAVIQARFGDEAVIVSPSDPEANNRAVAAGKTLVSGRELPKAIWAHVRENEILIPSTKEFKTQKPYESARLGDQIELEVKDSALTDSHKAFRMWYAAFTSAVMGGVSFRARFVNNRNEAFQACQGIGSTQTTFNLAHLKNRFFEADNVRNWADLAIHELGHYRCGNHLSEAYYNELTKIAGLAFEAALKSPRLMKPETYAAEVIPGGR